VRSFFLDGSALAKRYVAEPGTLLVDQLFNHLTADRLVVLNVGFAEVVSVLVRRRNGGVLSGATFSQAMLQLGQEIIHAANLRKLEPTNALVIAALAHIQAIPSTPPTPSSCMPRSDWPSICATAATTWCWSPRTYACSLQLRRKGCLRSIRKLKVKRPWRRSWGRNRHVDSVPVATVQDAPV
jgi:hypothetical protein